LRQIVSDLVEVCTDVVAGSKLNDKAAKWKRPNGRAPPAAPQVHDVIQNDWHRSGTAKQQSGTHDSLFISTRTAGLWAITAVPINWNNSPAVMPALVAGIHVFAAFQVSKAWTAGT
jgi:hypothetical protein